MKQLTEKRETVKQTYKRTDRQSSNGQLYIKNLKKYNRKERQTDKQVSCIKKIPIKEDCINLQYIEEEDVEPICAKISEMYLCSHHYNTFIKKKYLFYMTQ